MTEYVGKINTQFVGNGNSSQRRKLRRYLYRVAIPLVENDIPLAQIAVIAEVRFQLLCKFLAAEGYIKSAWMYRRVGEVKS